MCKCECGNKRNVWGCNLKSGKVFCCGCKRRGTGKDNYRFAGYEDISANYWLNLKKNAEIRNIDLEITKEIVWKQYIKQNRKCALSGQRISFADKTASVDRIDSNVGYIPSNIQIVHKIINIMKNKLQDEDFIYWCNLVAYNNVSWRMDNLNRIN